MSASVIHLFSRNENDDRSMSREHLEMFRNLRVEDRAIIIHIIQDRYACAEAMRTGQIKAAAGS